MASDLHFYFAWVDPTDTTFSSAFGRTDEEVFNLDIGCKEGDIPTATVEVINPRVGLIATGRKVWAWISMSNDGGATFTPLFFGRLVGLPKSMLGNVIKLDFVARAPDYIRQKQHVAETLKVLPEYDPLFFDVLKRDDPDAILEGYSKLYAIDRITNQVSVSDFLQGEDGTFILADDDVYYDSVQIGLQQSPLTAVNVKAMVTWRQQFTGFFNVGTWSYPTLGSEPFVNDWPKSGAPIGGGYSGAISWAGIIDTYAGTMTSSNASGSYNWQNTARSHHFADAMSITTSWSFPTQPMTMFTVLEEAHNGQLNPDAVDAGGNPAPINDPEWYRREQVGVRLFALDYAGRTATATLGLRYDANRLRYERLDMTIQADVQPILIDPLVTEDTETITLKSGDLGLPVTAFLNWSSVAGLHVDLGTVIFPDNPHIAGQTSSQIAVTAGTAGLIEPNFSNIAGVTTNDGGVVWSSLGDTPPSDAVQDWQQFARVPAGTLVLPRPVSGAPDIATLVALGNLGFNSRGVPTAKYTVYAENNGAPGDTMMECIQAGIFGGASAATIEAIIDANAAVLTYAGLPAYFFNTANYSPSAEAIFEKFINPSGQMLYIAVQGGVSSEFRLTWDETPGAQTVDGSVIWQCLGPVTLPIGGWPGMTPRASYFPSDRGQQSLQHLICRARAKLRRRARAVQVSFQCRFEAVAAEISCRMSAQIHDVRIPGGVAKGKVVSYHLRRDGSSGGTIADVVIGCSIGHGPGLSGSTSATGTATYVTGVFNPGEVQFSTGVIAALPSNPDDIGYTPPVELPVDDGVTFPIYGVGDTILTNQWHGLPSTLNPTNIEAYNIQIAATVHELIVSSKATASFSWGGPGQGTAGSATYTVPITNYASLAASIATRLAQIAGQGTSLWYELVLKNLQGGPYNASYVINTTKLVIPMTIDLSAVSSGG